MKGNIITRERCLICNKVLKHDDRRHGLFCPDHPQIYANKKFTVRFGRKIQRQFNTYNKAALFLNGLRFKTSEGSFDHRDYQADKPHAFSTLAEKYLHRKKNLKSFKEKRRHITVALDHFQDTNIKDISGAEIEDYLFEIPDISKKTRHNYKSALHDLFNWVLKRQVIMVIPPFPEIKFELGYRTITDIDTQGAIINKIRELTEDINPKIWFGIDLLATYVNLRPGDLLKIREKDINAQYGLITIHYPTKSKNKLKTVRLLQEHIEYFAEMKKRYTAIPELKFFRHHGGTKSMKVNAPFGPKYFKVWWTGPATNWGWKVWICTAEPGTPVQRRLPDAPALKMPGRHQPMIQTRHLTGIVSSKMIRLLKWQNYLKKIVRKYWSFPKMRKGADMCKSAHSQHLFKGSKTVKSLILLHIIGGGGGS